LQRNELPDSTMQAIRVGQIRRVICASPDYLAKNGIPTSPDDLHAHTIISASSVTPNPEWMLVESGETRTIRLHCRCTWCTERVDKRHSGFAPLFDLAIERLRQDATLN
jgi:DNA-binding transcriptional LysR family regulator